MKPTGSSRKWSEDSPLFKLVCLAPILVLLVLLFIYPVGRILALSFTGQGGPLFHYARIFNKSLYLRIFLQTFRLGFVVTAFCLLIGYPVAYLLANKSQRTSGRLMILVLMPFWTSLLVRTYAWMVLLQRSGIVNSLLLKAGLISQPLALMYNSFGVTVGMVHALAPFMVLTLYGVMKGINADYLKAAGNLGANPLKAFLRVYLPLSLPGVSAGCLLVFIISIGYYITPALLGGLRDMTISMLIEGQISKLLDWGFASALSVLLLAMTAVVLYIYDRVLGLDKMLGGGI